MSVVTNEMLFRLISQPRVKADRNIENTLDASKDHTNSGSTDICNRK